MNIHEFINKPPQFLDASEQMVFKFESLSYRTVFDPMDVIPQQPTSGQRRSPEKSWVNVVAFSKSNTNTRVSLECPSCLVPNMAACGDIKWEQEKNLFPMSDQTLFSCRSFVTHLKIKNSPTLLERPEKLHRATSSLLSERCHSGSPWCRRS